MITGVVIVNVAVPKSVPPSAPVAVTMYPAAAPDTVNVQPLMVPDPEAVHALGEPIVPLPLIVNVTVVPSVNPLPDAVTGSPLGPWLGVSVIEGSPPLATIRSEELGAAEEGPGEGDAPTVALEPPADTV